MSGRRLGITGKQLALFASLYTIQGIVIAYFFNFNQGYLVAAGLESETVGMVQSLALIPLVLRFLGGPLSDRFNLFGLGHRRPYIMLGVALQGLGLVGLSRVHPALHLVGFTALAVMTVIGLALYDTATDGFILDVTTAENRPRIQGFLIAMRFLGATLTSVGFGYWLERTGNGPGRGDGVLWACAGLGLVPLGLTLAVPERPREGNVETFRWEALGVMIQRRSLVLLLFGTLYAIVAYAVEINLSLFYNRALGMGDQAIGTLGALRYVGRAVGAILLGLAAKRLGRFGILVTGIVVLAISVGGQSLVAGSAMAGIMALLFGLANGWNDALFYVLAMEASDPRMAASTCALFMSVTNLSVTGGAIFGVAVKLAGGRYVVVFRLAALIVLGALALVPTLSRPPSNKEESEEDAGALVKEG